MIVCLNAVLPEQVRMLLPAHDGVLLAVPATMIEETRRVVVAAMAAVPAGFAVPLEVEIPPLQFDRKRACSRPTLYFSAKWGTIDVVVAQLRLSSFSRQIMNQPPRPIRIATVVWTLVIGSLILFFAVGLLLPSTKRARLHFQLPRDEQQPPGDEQPQAISPTGEPTKPPVARP